MIEVNARGNVICFIMKDEINNENNYIIRNEKRGFDLDNTKRTGVQILRPESRAVGVCAMP